MIARAAWAAALLALTPGVAAAQGWLRRPLDDAPRTFICGGITIPNSADLFTEHGIGGGLSLGRHFTRPSGVRLVVRADLDFLPVDDAFLGTTDRIGGTTLFGSLRGGVQMERRLGDLGANYVEATLGPGYSSRRRVTYFDGTQDEEGGAALVFAVGSGIGTLDPETVGFFIETQFVVHLDTNGSSSVFPIRVGLSFP